MKLRLAVFALVGLMALSAQADPMVQNAQQALKDQGFYYGEITGEKNADTTAAIRRYQIRNGLQITGELNDETLRALRNNVSTSTPTPTPRIAAANPDTSDLRAEPSRENPPLNSTPARPF